MLDRLGTKGFEVKFLSHAAAEQTISGGRSSVIEHSLRTRKLG